MTGAYVARDVRVRVMPPLLAFNEDLFRDVLRAFDNLDERANETANEFFNKYPGNEYTDPGDVADWANDHSLAWWETMVSLRQSMVNLLAAGLYHLIEQQLGALSLDCAYERVRDTNLDVVKTWYMTNLGIDLSSLEPWGQVTRTSAGCELRKACRGRVGKATEGVAARSVPESGFRAYSSRNGSTVV
jgi:hypothetical protein